MGLHQVDLNMQWFLSYWSTSFAVCCCFLALHFRANSLAEQVNLLSLLFSVSSSCYFIAVYYLIVLEGFFYTVVVISIQVMCSWFSLMIFLWCFSVERSLPCCSCRGVAHSTGQYSHICYSCLHLVMLC